MFALAVHEGAAPGSGGSGFVLNEARKPRAILNLDFVAAECLFVGHRCDVKDLPHLRNLEVAEVAQRAHREGDNLWKSWGHKPEEKNSQEP